MQARRTQGTTDDRRWTTVHFHLSCVVYLFGPINQVYLKIFSVVNRLSSVVPCVPWHP